MSVWDCPLPIVLIVVVWILHDATSTVYVVKVPVVNIDAVCVLQTGPPSLADH